MIVKEISVKINGHDLLLRNAKEEDTEMLIEYLKTTCGETRFLIKEPEEITLTPQEEREYIHNINESKNSIMLLGFYDGQFVGNCSFNGIDLKRCRHRVTMGIALYQTYTGLGIGKIMMEKLIEVARERGIEQIELEVAADNDRAISLYKKMGFEIYGTLPCNMKYKDGTYADMYWMMKKL